MLFGLLVALGLMVILGFARIQAAQAQTSGTPSARLDATIDAWLSDDELAALQAMAGLAQAGDVTAQVLLGLIDKHAALQGPAVLALPRDGRIALLRAPGGISGQNWLHLAAQQGDPLAQAWTSVFRPGAGLDTAAQFAAMSEPRALALALTSLAKRQEHGFKDSVIAKDWYPDTLLFLGRDRTLTQARAAALHPGDPQHRYHSGARPAKAELADWLAQAPAALHLRAACDAVCPDTQRHCVMALYHALGDYQALLTHGTPANTLIPDEVFAASPRGRAALARRIMLMRSTRMREADREALSTVDSCATDWLGTQYAAHTPRAIPAAEN